MRADKSVWTSYAQRTTISIIWNLLAFSERKYTFEFTCFVKYNHWHSLLHMKLKICKIYLKFDSLLCNILKMIIELLLLVKLHLCVIKINVRYYARKNVCDFNIIDKNKEFSMFVKFILKSHHNWLIILEHWDRWHCEKIK